MEILIEFEDQSPSFTHGVEFGRILQKMEQGEMCITNNNFPVHKENIKVLRDAGRTYGYKVSFTNCQTDGWINFVAIKNIQSNN